MTNTKQLATLMQQITDAAVEIHERLGNVFELSIYQQAMAVELKLRNIPFTLKTEMNMVYKGFSIGPRRIIFWLKDDIVMELHKCSSLENVHVTQALNYTHAFNRSAALIVNFGHSTIQAKQIINKQYSLPDQSS